MRYELPLTYRDLLAVRGAATGTGADLPPLPEYRDAPQAFFADILGLDVWAGQVAVMTCVAFGKRLTAVRSGQKTGKTISAAGLALWWAATRPKAFVLITSGSESQLRDTLWRELRQLHKKAEKVIGGKASPDPIHGVHWSDGRRIVGRTPSASEPERFAGYSSPELFIIIDEASRFPETLFEAARGNLAGGGKLLALANPVRTSGWFYRLFREKAETWNRLRLSSRDTPNASGEGEPIPGLATREFIEELEREYGRDSPIVKVRIDGDFAELDDNTIVTLDMLDDAHHASGLRTGRLVAALDVARHGNDSSVLLLRDGFDARLVTATQHKDSHQLAHWAVEQLREYQELTLAVDVVGVGAGVYDVLYRISPEKWAVIPFNSASKPRDKTKFPKRRDEAFWAVREWLQEGGKLPSHDRLEAELLAHTYDLDAQGRIRVIDKESVKKRLGRSPDFADALAMAVWTQPADYLEPVRVGPLSERQGSSAGW